MKNEKLGFLNIDAVYVGAMDYFIISQVPRGQDIMDKIMSCNHINELMISEIVTGMLQIIVNLNKCGYTHRNISAESYQIYDNNTIKMVDLETSLELMNNEDIFNYKLGKLQFKAPEFIDHSG